VVVQKTTEEINVDRDVGTIWTENFGMTTVSEEMVPESLSEDQKETTSSYLSSFG
jgi:hypothetical protein